METKMKESASTTTQVIELELNGEMQKFGVEEIKELSNTKDFWYKQWCDVVAQRDKLLAQIEAFRPFLESVNLYQVITKK